MSEKTKDRDIPTTSIKKRRGIRLRSPDDIVRLLSKRINKILYEPDQSNIDILRAVAYASGIMLKAFEIGQLADRIKSIEEKIGIDKKYIN